MFCTILATELINYLTTNMTKHITTVMLIALPFMAINSQVGIGTTNPDPSSELHIESTDSGLLIPRLTTSQRDAIPSPAIGLLIYNTDTNKYEYNTGNPSTPNWNTVSNSPAVSTDTDNQIETGSDGGALLGRTVHMGKFIINSGGDITITGLPFEPSQIKFTAHANVETSNLNIDNGVGDNNNGIHNTFGSMSGFATNYNGTIDQQVIFIGGSGNSINDISRYASSSNCIGVRYTNQNGNRIGSTLASVTSFNSDGFTLNVGNFSDGLIVLYEAYR